MKLLIATVFLSLSLLLSACATQWSRTDTSAEQLAQDLDSCQLAATEEYPVVSSRTLPSYQSQNSVGCSGGGDCRAKPGSSLQEPAQDLNRAGREESVRRCMEEKNYSQP